MLTLTLPFGMGETATSFCSRMAARNRCLTAQEFCLDMGISMQEIANGTKAALSALAHLGGVEYEVLWASALRRIGVGIACGDNRFDRAFVRPKARLAFCPACLQSDGTDQLTAYERTAWRFTPIRTCTLHDLVLIEDLGKPDADLSPYDFHNRTERFAERPQSIRSRVASGLESYVASRLREGFVGGTPWLDAMSIQIVAEASEHLGVLEKFGANATRTSLTDDQLHEAGGIGFGILTEGPAAFQRCLKDSMMRHPGGSNALAANISFCEHLYRWLDKANGADESRREMKNLIRELMLCSRPLSPDDKIFGEPIGERRLYSLYQAAKICGMHATRLRRLLHVEGVLDDTQLEKSPQKTVFPANARTTHLLKRLRGAMPLSTASAYIGAPRVQFDLLRKAGLIEPLVPATGGALTFSSHDLTAFLERLLRRIPMVASIDEGLVDIPSAAKRARCSGSDVVRMILEAKLHQLQRHRHLHGFTSIRVCPVEVRKVLNHPERADLSISQVEARTGYSRPVIRALIDNGWLNSRQIRNPVSRVIQPIVDPADLANFVEEFVALSALARECREFPGDLRLKLGKLGIRPAFDPDLAKATFYRREELSALP